MCLMPRLRILLVLGLSVQPTLANDNTLPKKVMDSWNKYLDAARLYTIKISKKLYRLEGETKKPISEEVDEARLGKNFGRIVMGMTYLNNNDESKAVLAFNSKYAFRLMHRPNGYVLDKIDFNPKAGSSSFEPELLTFHYICMCPGLVVHGVWLPDAIQSQDCKIREWKTIQEGSGRFLNLRFSYRKTFKTPKGNPALVWKDASVFLDEDKSMLIRRYELWYSTPRFDGKVITENELDDSDDSIPVVKRSISHYKIILHKGGIKESEEVTEYQSERKPLTEADCSLTAFGLPEPPGIKWKKPTLLYVWILGAALLSLTLMGVFRWLVRRKLSKV
jgi:hypothetical protein